MERLDRLDTVIFKHMKKRYTQKGWLERLDLDLMRVFFLRFLSRMYARRASPLSV